MLPITSAEPASRLAGLTDNFDLGKHEDLLLVDTYACCWRERLMGWGAGIEDASLILRLHPTEYEPQGGKDR